MTGADGLIAVTPVFSASYSGLFKSFFDVLEPDAIRGQADADRRDRRVGAAFAGTGVRVASPDVLPARPHGTNGGFRRHGGFRDRHSGRLTDRPDR